MRILVSACLVGDLVRYDGGTNLVPSPILQAWVKMGLVIPFCPEVAGGLPVPRPPAEIRGEGGESVLEGMGQVVTRAGADLTQDFLRGALGALEAAQSGTARVAILKEASPSCGCHSIHDGSFSGRQIPGQGVAAALLHRHGIAIFSEHELQAARDLFDRLVSAADS